MTISFKRIWDLVDAVEALVHKTLSSRKAVAALSGVGAGLAAHNLGLVAASVLSYIGVEGYVDGKAAKAAAAVPAPVADVPPAA